LRGRRDGAATRVSMGPQQGWDKTSGCSRRRDRVQAGSSILGALASGTVRLERKSRLLLH